MNKTKILKLLSLCFCFVLIAAMALNLCGCKDDKAPDTSAPAMSDEVITVGEGENEFTFKVTTDDGTKTYKVMTDKTIVGEALLDNGLIAGDESEFGLYVKSVDGILADYDTTKTYWAFYVDGQYAMSGAHTTEIEEGKIYEFRIEKA